mgnify:CR=1 FL=1
MNVLCVFMVYIINALCVFMIVLIIFMCLLWYIMIILCLFTSLFFTFSTLLLPQLIQEAIKHDQLDVPTLYLDLHSFLTAWPPAEWKRRVSENVPLGDMPLRTIKAVILEIVTAIPNSVFDHFGRISNPQKSYVMMYVKAFHEKYREAPRQEIGHVMKEKEREKEEEVVTPVSALVTPTEATGNVGNGTGNDTGITGNTGNVGNVGNVGNSITTTTTTIPSSTSTTAGISNISSSSTTTLPPSSALSSSTTSSSTSSSTWSPSSTKTVTGSEALAYKQRLESLRQRMGVARGVDDVTATSLAAILAPKGDDTTVSFNVHVTPATSSSSSDVLPEVKTLSMSAQQREKERDHVPAAEAKQIEDIRERLNRIKYSSQS